MDLPTPRGPLTETLFSALRSGDDFFAVLTVLPDADADDAALALWVLHQLHYRDLTGVPDDLEWDPQLLGVARSAGARPRAAAALPVHRAVGPGLRRRLLRLGRASTTAPRSLRTCTATRRASRCWS